MDLDQLHIVKFLEVKVVSETAEEVVLAIEVLVTFLYYTGSPKVGPAGKIAESGYTGSAEAGHTEVTFLYYAGSLKVGPAGMITEAGHTGSTESGYTEAAFLY